MIVFRKRRILIAAGFARSTKVKNINYVEVGTVLRVVEDKWFFVVNKY
jgi:hypothetical protein